MSTKLFITLPFLSHFYPMMNFAKSLKQENDLFVFTGLEYQKNFIEQNDFCYKEFNYLKSIKIGNFKTFLKILVNSTNPKLFYRQRAREFIDFKNSCLDLYSQYSPDEIFLDEHLLEYYWFFKPFNSEISIINTKLSTKKSRGIPPLNSLYLPRCNFISYMLCEILWSKNFIKLKGMFLIEKMAFLGKNDDYFINKISRKQGLTRPSEINYNNCFYPGIKGLKTIILAPDEIEFPFKQFSKNEVYIWNNEIRNEAPHVQESYLTILAKIKELKEKNSSLKLIYVSFGTISNNFKTEIDYFLNLLIKITNIQKNWILLISSSNLKINTTSTNQVYCLPFYPQQDVLKKVDLFITHCGLGSIKEGYLEKKPMLLVPINKKSDQLGNASRMLFLGNSQYLNINKYSRGELIDKINRLINKIY